MKILSWIIPAAALITTAWATTVPPFDNSASDGPEDGPPPVRQHPQTAPPLVKSMDNHRVTSDAAHAHPFSFAMFQRCRQHMNQNSQWLKTAQQVALECHSNVIYLRRNFERYAHQTPEQYLLHLKLTHAAELRRPMNETL